MEVGIEISATNGDHTDRWWMMQGTRALTPPVCLQKELTLCVRNVLPPAWSHPEDGMGRIRIFSQKTQAKVGCLLPFLPGGTLAVPPLPTPSSSAPSSPNPRENVLILYTPMAGACSTATFWVLLLTGALGKGRGGL